ncbi:MAG: hypothetical protein AAF363_17895 [Bacteroidota bacterium]
MTLNKTFKSVSQFSFLIALLVFLESCGSGKKSEKESASSEFDAASHQINEEIDEVIQELPPPSEIPFLLEEIGADYDESLVNAIENAESYNTTTDKAAVNLGIYTADIGYLASYDKAQRALSYLSECKKLAEAVGITDEVGKDFVERFEKNVGSRDSLEDVVDDFISRSDKQLQFTDRETVAALVLSGSFIEGLYLATAIIENYPEDVLPDDARNLILVPIVKLVLDQEQPLADLIQLLKDLPESDNDMVKSLVSSLQSLKGKYEDLNIQEKIQGNRGDLLLTDETLDEITNQTGEIRDFITSANAQ